MRIDELCLIGHHERTICIIQSTRLNQLVPYAPNLTDLPFFAPMSLLAVVSNSPN